MIGHFQAKLAMVCLLAAVLTSCQSGTAMQNTHHYSTVVRVALADWKPGTNTAGQTGFTVDLPIAAIDDGVVDHGGVAVYYKFAGSDRYEPLPLVFNGVIYHAYHSKGLLSLRMFSANGGNLGSRPPSEVTDFEAKIVLF